MAKAKVSTPHNNSGSCAVIALFINDTLYIANTGDCRALLFTPRAQRKSCPAVVMSLDHKPGVPSERRRIERCGGMVKECIVSLGDTSGKANKRGRRKAAAQAGFSAPRSGGLCGCFAPKRRGPRKVRIHRCYPGGLAVSRAFGDLYAKHDRGQIKAGRWVRTGAVIAEPYIRSQELEAQLQCLVLATDGFWDHVLNNNIAKLRSIFDKAVKKHKHPKKIASVVANELLAWAWQNCGSNVLQDNTTIMVLVLHPRARSFY